MSPWKGGTLQFGRRTRHADNKGCWRRRAKAVTRISFTFDDVCLATCGLELDNRTKIWLSDHIHCSSHRLRGSLSLQFKPQHIAAGAVSLAANVLNFDLSTAPSLWQEFQATSSIIQDVVKQLTELS